MNGNNALELPNAGYEDSTTGDLDVLALGMSDDDIQRAIGNRVTQSESFWNDKLKLNSVRETVEKHYLNNYYTESDIYDFQAEYKDNRIFIAIETLVALVTSNPPQPIATQAYDTEASYELAQQLQRALLSKYEDLYLKSKLQLIARHLLLGYRLGVMKIVWDDTVGALQKDGSRFGDVGVLTLRPQRVVIDAGAQDINDVPLIGEYKSDLLEDLCDKFPSKRDAIILEAGKTKGIKSDFTKREGYVEVHFTTRVSGRRTEAIAWKYKTLVLDAKKTPFWNYNEVKQDQHGQPVATNFLTKPSKPYALFNYLNLGKWVMDDTSLTEQAIPLQIINDRRGRQIVENADQANGGWVFNTQMVKAEDAQGWINNPADKILANGNVNDAVARLSAPQLDQSVIQDKIDARNEIDNIFGTHGATKGEVTDSKTLGQDVLSQRGDSARLNVLVTSIEDGSDRLYKGITQAMKVFYDEPQLIRYTPKDDATMFFSFGQDQIETGAAIRVKSGSVLPEDPASKKQEVKEMLPILDPLSIAEGLNKENPKEWAKRNLYYRIFPDKYLTEILKVDPNGGTGQDPLALQHIQLLNQGQAVPPEPNPTKEHLATHTAFIQSPDFAQLPPEIQQLHKDHVQAELAASKQAMGMGDQRAGIPNSSQPAVNSGTPPDAMGTQPQQMPSDIMNQPQQ